MVLVDHSLDVVDGVRGRVDGDHAFVQRAVKHLQALQQDALDFVFVGRICNLLLDNRRSGLTSYREAGAT